MISFNGAFRLKRRALGCICSQGTIESMDLIGVFIPQDDYAVLCCVNGQNLLAIAKKGTSLRKEVSS